MSTHALPVVVIGAGPIGLAAAAHLVAHGETPLVLEAGATVAASVRQWEHVHLFSPWQYNIDAVARSLLEAAGWRAPDPEAFPTGAELIDHYLAPLAALPQLAPHIFVQRRVTAITRKGFDKMKTIGRENAPFVVFVQHADGHEEAVLAKAVIYASGTYSTPNPIGANGVPAIGEAAAAAHIFYGIPNVPGAHRKRFANRRVLVLGSGHSAFNAISDLAALGAEAPDTEIVWAVRRASVQHLFGGGERDLLPARGRLGTRVRELVEAGRIQLVTDFRAEAVTSTTEGLIVVGEHGSMPAVDEIVVTTGFRPDLSFLHELRLGLDPAVESPTALAPLIDPNIHSCGTVRPHGAIELSHPEPNFYIVGMKSYGRAPTFLMLTGYEQVRSIVAAITGDWEAARNVELELPETGVCFTNFDSQNVTSGGCCGGSQPDQQAQAGRAANSCSADIPLQITAPILPLSDVTQRRGGCC